MFGEGFPAVIAAARRGEETAWTDLYLDLAPVLTGYLRGQRCPNAEDVVSETMLQIVRDLRRFDGTEGQFRSWVFTIARHRMVDAWRRARSRPADPVEHADLEAVMPAEAGVEVDDPAELEALLAACSPDQREVMLLRYVADLSLHQVAEVLGKEYNAVKALHRRALNALRAHVDEGAYLDRTHRTLTPSG